MFKNPDIQKELEQLAPALSKIERKNPFKVPENYFNNQPQILTAACKGEEPALSNRLQSLKDQSIFKVPQDYFEQLSGRINNTVMNIEKDEVSLNQKAGTFSVPTGYFSKMPQMMLEKAKEAEANEIIEEHLRPLTAKNPFTVPQGYFEAFPQAILETVKISENEEAINQIVAQTIRPIAAKNPMTVPQGYFEQFSQTILATVKASGNIEAEEQAINQIVAQTIRPITAKNPMSVPQGYCANFSQTILETVKEAEASQIVEEKIRPLDKADSFKTPPAYFEEVPQRVSEKVAEPKQDQDLPAEKGGRVIEMEPAAPRKAKTVPMWRRAMAVAATVLMVAVGAWFFINSQKPTGGGIADGNEDKQGQELLADLNPADELRKSLSKLTNAQLNDAARSEGLEEMDESILMEGMNGKDLINFDNINSDAIQQYLLEELDADLLKDLI